MKHELDIGQLLEKAPGVAITDEGERFAFLDGWEKWKVEFFRLQRAEAYPSIADQLDTLYHGGYDAWKAQVQAVKEQFPKPE